MQITREITLTKSPYLIMKSDYTVIENWEKISHSLTGKHQVDLSISSLLPWELIHVSIIHSPSPFSIPESYTSLLHLSILSFYMLWCTIPRGEQIWGKIMLSWALAFWIITEN